MKNSNGNLGQKTLLKAYPISNLAKIAEILALFGLGALAIVLHIKMRTPLKLPGHHGLEFMALLMLGRYASGFKYASSISSLGVGLMLLFPIWGGKDPFAGIVYMLPGFALDFMFYHLKRKSSMLLIALIGGIAYGLIPVTRIIITTITGFPYGSLLTGYLFPLVTFTVFGFVGSLFGASLMKQLRKSKN